MSRVRTEGYTADQLRRMAAAYKVMGEKAYSGRQWEMEYCSSQNLDCQTEADRLDALGTEPRQETRI